jgi:hypothetical protein
VDELRPAAANYLQKLSRALGGSARSRKRLLVEVEDHIADSTDHQIALGVEPAEAERRALEQLGDVATIKSAWEMRSARQRRRTRRHLALTIAATTIATLLAVAQHAQGGHTPTTPARCEKTTSINASGQTCSPPIVAHLKQARHRPGAAS